MESRLNNAVETTLCLLGLAFWWPFLRRGSMSLVITGDAMDAGAFSIYLVAIVACALGCALAGPRLFAVIRHPWMIIVVGLLAAGGWLCIDVFGYSAIMGPPAVVMHVLATILFAILLLYVLMTQGALTERRRLLVLVGSLVISHVMTVIWRRRHDASVFIDAYPLVVGLCVTGCLILRRLSDRQMFKPSAVGGNRPAQTGAIQAVGTKNAVDLGPNRAIYLYLLALLLLCSITTGFMQSEPYAALGEDEATSRNFLSVLISTCLLVTTVLCRSATAARYALVIVSSLVYFLGNVLAITLTTSALGIVTGFMGSGRACVLFLMVSLLAVGTTHGTAGNEQGEALIACLALRVFALFFVPLAVSNLIWGVLFPACIEWLDLAYADYRVRLPLFLGAGIALCLIILLVYMVASKLGPGQQMQQAFDGASPDKPTPSIPQSPARHSNEAAAFAHRYNLNDNETNTLLLILGGNTFKKIADLRGISLDAVRGHAKSLYRKVGVHSKQELIDLARDLPHNAR